MLEQIPSWVTRSKMALWIPIPIPRLWANSLSFFFSDQVRNERKETQSPAAVHDLVLAFVQLDLRSLIDVLAVALYG